MSKCSYIPTVVLNNLIMAIMLIMEIVKLLIFSFFAVTYLFFISKLMGKKQIAQLEFIDYVMGISVGSIASEMATDISDKPFYYYLISMTVFFLVDYFISFIGRKGPKLKHFFKGRPQMIIYNGKIEYETLKKSKLDVNDVISMCREKGFFDINNVAFAIFETSGKLSVMPKGEYNMVKIQDLKLPVNKSVLPYYLIIDGKISYSTLTEINKDKTWLFEKAKLTKKSLKKVIFASYEVESDTIIVQTKS